MRSLFPLLLMLSLLALYACQGASGHRDSTSMTESSLNAETETSFSDTMTREDETSETETGVGETSEETCAVPDASSEEALEDSYAYEYYIDITPYLSFICPTEDDSYLVLANRYHPLGKSYVPSDLITLSTSASWYLREAARYALDAMMQEMRVLGVCDTYPQSTYRSYDLQDRLYKMYLERERGRRPDLSTDRLMQIVDTYSARPGTSDHQTGLAVDFSPINESFEWYAAFDYLTHHAHKFGYILRFPKGKTYLTGYKYESWHWRFVGREVATYLYENDLTLEEYHALLNGVETETFAPATDPPPITNPPTTAPPITDPPTTSTDAEEDDPPITSTDAEEDDPPITSTDAEEDDPPTTSSGEEEDDPPTTSSGEKEDDPPTTSSGEEEDDPPTTSSGEEEDDPPTTSSGEEEDDPPTTSSGEKEDDPPTTSSGEKEDDPPTISSDKGSDSEEPPL